MFANPDEEVPLLIRFQVWFFLSIMPRSTIQSASSYQVHVTTAAHQCRSLPLSHKIVLAELLLEVSMRFFMTRAWAAFISSRKLSAALVSKVLASSTATKQSPKRCTCLFARNKRECLALPDH